ncbi:MAG TPA: CvpA family protein [Rhizomicrobium sp.]|jgi:membrane protein required for colicin V production|nr:CvpA family protein [Rhizomicrobium sp.]
MSLSVTFIDCLIVLIIVVSAGYAAWRGFLWETLTIFAWVAAAFACLYFGPYIIPLTRSLVQQDWLASLLAYAAVFLAVFIPLAFMSSRFSESVKKSPIGPLDRAAGVAFGIVRGLVIVGLAYLAFTYFVPIRNQPRWVTQARLLPMVQSAADVLLTVIPDHPRDYAYVPKHEEEVRQAPPQMDQNARNSGLTGRHDPMAELIRKNEAANSVPKSTPSASNASVQHKTTAKVTKSYGASDREALDRLVETGGTNR